MHVADAPVCSSSRLGLAAVQFGRLRWQHRREKSQWKTAERRHMAKAKEATAAAERVDGREKRKESSRQAGSCENSERKLKAEVRLRRSSACVMSTSSRRL